MGMTVPCNLFNTSLLNEANVMHNDKLEKIKIFNFTTITSIFILVLLFQWKFIFNFFKRYKTIKNINEKFLHCKEHVSLIYCRATEVNCNIHEPWYLQY